jgi:hypothetical protein
MTQRSLVTFVSVGLAVFAGFVLQAMALVAVGRDAPPVPLLLLLTPVPAVAATLVFGVLTRFEGGRQGLALTAVFLGSLAATVVFPFLGLVGLFLTMAAAGGTAVLARRLLVPPPGA